MSSNFLIARNQTAESACINRINSPSLGVGMLSSISFSDIGGSICRRNLLKKGYVIAGGLRGIGVSATWTYVTGTRKSSWAVGIRLNSVCSEAVNYRCERSWSSSYAIRLRPHRSGRAGFPHPALPECNPRHIRACAQVRVRCGTGSVKRAVRISKSNQLIRWLF